MKNYHAGWAVFHNHLGPVTGKYSARRAGVSICAGTHEALCRMIDVRNHEEREERARRERENLAH